MERKIDKCKQNLLNSLNDLKELDQPVIENRDKSLFL
jgi:hypothetical protein